MTLDPLPAGLVTAWERLLACPEKLTLDPASGVCDAVFDDPLLFPLQRQAEMAAMLKLAAGRSPKVVCEIGTDKGGGLLHWCLLPTVRRVIACEIRGVPYASRFEDAFPRVDFVWVDQSSRNPTVLRAIEAVLLGQRIDVLFLDGEKAAFEADFDAYLPLMNPSSGLILMHDVTDYATGDAYRRIKARGRHPCAEIIDRTDVALALDRERQGSPPLTSHEQWLRWWKGRSCGVGVIELGRKAS